MDPVVIVLLAVAVLLLLLVFETPASIALASAGMLGFVLLRNEDFATTMLGSTPFNATADFTLTLIPMYILIGMLALHGRIAQQVYAIAYHYCKRMPAGLAIATVAACAGFAAVSGSSVATSATMARLSVGEMERYGYPRRFAAGLVAAAGTLGAMIPPSVILVFYSVVSGESTGQMIAAGILPGFFSALVYAAYLGVWGMINRDKITPLKEMEKGVTDETREVVLQATKEVGKARHLPWRGAVRLVVLFTIIVGGLYSGIVTATESAALGAVFALIMMLWELRQQPPRELLGKVRQSLQDAASTTSMIFAVLVGSLLFSLMLVASKVPDDITAYLTSLPLAPMAVVGILVLLLLPLGMALESISILAICVPLIHPVVTDFGFSGVWLGVLMVKAIEIGLVTPPVGISAFVVAGNSKASVEEVFRGVLPFLLLDIGLLALFFFNEDLVLWLPSLVR